MMRNVVSSMIGQRLLSRRPVSNMQQSISTMSASSLTWPWNVTVPTDPSNTQQQQEQQQEQRQKDLNHAIHQVRSYDPAGYLPGRLLPTINMQLTYYAVRSFWVESGLRFGTTALVPPNSRPLEHLEWWEQGIDAVFQDNREQIQVQNKNDHHDTFLNHPTLRLLYYLRTVQNINFTKCHFEDVLKGRRLDLDLKQYPTLTSLEEHAIWSCGSLSQLVLESHDIFQDDVEKGGDIAHEIARQIGTCHGLANALRLSIPIVSTTGKLIIPQDLCEKHGVTSPRYLLSALGQGDASCRHALQRVVEDIATSARDHLEVARSQRKEILTHDSGNAVVSTFLPVLASETFLNRLERYEYDLTNPDLRRVTMMEHGMCAGRMVAASYNNQY